MIGSGALPSTKRPAPYLKFRIGFRRGKLVKDCD